MRYNKKNLILVPNSWHTAPKTLGNSRLTRLLYAKEMIDGWCIEHKEMQTFGLYKMDSVLAMIVMSTGM